MEPMAEPFPPNTAMARSITDWSKGEGVGADVVRAAVGEQPAPEACVARREGEGHDLVVGRVHSRGLGRHLILPDGHEGATHAGALEPDGSPGEEDQRHGRHIEEGAGVLQLKGADTMARESWGCHLNLW